VAAPLSYHNLLRMQAKHAAGDALAVWEALAYARGKEMEIPEWVLDALGAAASRLLALKTADPASVCEAVGLHQAGGGPTATRRRKAYERDLTLARSVAILRGWPGERWTDARIINHVARERGVKLREVKEAWRRYRATLGHPPKRRKQATTKAGWRTW
jgi:hypothetical protein